MTTNVSNEVTSDMNPQENNAEKIKREIKICWRVGLFKHWIPKICEAIQ